MATTVKEGEMCQILKNENNQKITTKCSKPRNNTKKIMVVQSMPVCTSNEPYMKPSINTKSNKIVQSQLRKISKCYAGKLKDGICEKPIEFVLLKDEKCSACHKFLPEIENRMNMLKKHKIPHTLTIHDIRRDKEKSSEMLSQIGCQGLPCLAIKDIQDPKSYRKITEGIDKPIAFFSNIMQ